jgi:hypothetical protein
MPLAYLAGPDVFLPNAASHAARKAAICAAHGITALPPLNEDIATLAGMTEEDAWRAIFAKDLAMMNRADLVIANLTPFAAPAPMPARWWSWAGSSAAGVRSSAIRTAQHPSPCAARRCSRACPTRCRG